MRGCLLGLGSRLLAYWLHSLSDLHCFCYMLPVLYWLAYPPLKAVVTTCTVWNHIFIAVTVVTCLCVKCGESLNVALGLQPCEEHVHKVRSGFASKRECRMRSAVVQHTVFPVTLPVRCVGVRLG